MKFPVLRRVLSVLLGPFIGRVEGIENIPKSGGAILAANHASYLDHFIIGVCIFARINRMIYFLAKKEHFETPLQRFWHRYLQAIPIDREAGGKDALAEAVHHLRRGDLIMIYPEGTRTRDGALQRAKTGVARLAFAAHVPVVPIGITNTFFILPKGKRIPRWGKKADVYIGKPITFNGSKNVDDVDAVRKATTLVMSTIAHLIGRKYPFDQEP